MTNGLFGQQPNYMPPTGFPPPPVPGSKEVTQNTWGANMASDIPTYTGLPLLDWHIHGFIGEQS